MICLRAMGKRDLKDRHNIVLGECRSAEIGLLRRLSSWALAGFADLDRGVPLLCRPRPAAAASPCRQRAFPAALPSAPSLLELPPSLVQNFLSMSPTFHSEAAVGGVLICRRSPMNQMTLLCLSADDVLLFAAVANAEVIPSFAGNTAKDPNLQLKLGGVGMTSVQGTGQTGIRTSAFKKGVLGNEKSATKFPRPGMNEVCAVMVCLLMAVPHLFGRCRLGSPQTQEKI